MDCKGLTARIDFACQRGTGIYLVKIRFQSKGSAGKQRQSAQRQDSGGQRLKDSDRARDFGKRDNRVWFRRRNWFGWNLTRRTSPVRV